MRGGARLIGVAGAALAFAVAGCQHTTPEQPAHGTGVQPKAFLINGAGTAKRLSLQIPDSIRAGITSIVFQNDAQGKHQLQFARVDGQHSDNAALKAATAWLSKGKPLPSWIHPAGGTPVTPSGTRSNAVEVIPQGHYIVADTAPAAPPKVSATFEATGTTEGALQGAPARIRTYEYGFKPIGLTIGTRYLIDNVGKQPHFVEAAPLKPGQTLADVKKSLKSGGKSPVNEGAAVRTPILDGHTRELIDLNLKHGRYALLCFVPDRQGGKPHAFKGMIGVANVR